MRPRDEKSVCFSCKNLPRWLPFSQGISHGHRCSPFSPRDLNIWPLYLKSDRKYAEVSGSETWVRLWRAACRAALGRPPAEAYPSLVLLWGLCQSAGCLLGSTTENQLKGGPSSMLPSQLVSSAEQRLPQGWVAQGPLLLSFPRQAFKAAVRSFQIF